MTRFLKKEKSGKNREINLWIILDEAEFAIYYDGLFEQYTVIDRPKDSIGWVEHSFQQFRLAADPKSMIRELLK